MDENDVQVRERLTALESSCKSLQKRVDKQESIIENIRTIVEEMKFMREDLNTVVAKVDEIEKKPAKRIETAVAAVIGTVIGGLCSALVSFFTGG